MSKGDFPALRMIVDGGRLSPATAFDAERLNSYRRGTVVFCKFTEEKDRVLVRKWFAIIGLVLKQCETPWKNKDEAHEAIKLALGIVNLSKTVSGQWMQYPRSLSYLEDPELQEALEQMIALLSRMTGVDVETLRKEAADVGREIEHSNSDETAPPPGPSDDAGDTALPSSAAAGEEMDSPSSSSPAATLSDAEWLQTAARMLWAATNVGDDTEANLSILNAQRLAVGDIEATPSQPTKDKAGSVYRQCKAVVLSEVDRATALKFIANMAGMEPKELEVNNG
ncbi:hypothetical protein ACFFP0_24830 [Rhizobium puerariae]|uniref:Uncharacterized protein n=1 Tax=Rhizobium puerariae TaxID=1585791 RepID=A0ABV6AQE5_9HYPH